jgi:hypothetical protein
MHDLRIAQYEGLASLPDSYRPMLERAGADSFFLSLPWFANFEQNILAPGEKVQIIGVESNTTQASARGALLMRRSRAHGGRWAPRRFEGLANYYTSFFAPLLQPGDDSGEVVRSMAAALWAERSSWDVLQLQPLDVDSAAYRGLCEGLRAAGAVVQTYFCFGNWYLEVGGRSFAQYLAGLSTTLKKNVPYYSRRLERMPDARVEIITGGAALDRAIADYARVYYASWKIPEPYPQFVDGLVRRAADNGWLRLGLVYIGDEPAAAQIWIVHGGTASIYKIAYDERFKKHSVGTVLTGKLMQHVIDADRVRVVDYLSGDDAYKKEWMSHRRERWGIVAFNPRSVRGAWQAVRNVGGRQVKALLHRLAKRREVALSPGQG